MREFKFFTGLPDEIEPESTNNLLDSDRTNELLRMIDELYGEIKITEERLNKPSIWSFIKTIWIDFKLLLRGQIREL